MMPYRAKDQLIDVTRDPAEALDETSDEWFDRMAYARHALELVRPERTTVAICEGTSRIRVESGRSWGVPGRGRWAMLAIPQKASRRAIALAVAELAQQPRPYVLDVLLGAGDEALRHR